jgi:alpha-tubulin suppressor-like RCC1 family protein
MGLSSRGQAGVIQPIVTTPRSVSGPGLVDALRVSGDRSCYLIGTQWSCWGDVDETPTVVPAAVSYSAFSQGRDHTCVVAAGEVRCAGTNDSGQLGLGSFTPAGDGVVVSPASFEDVVVGADFTCARSSGATYCWGEGDDGQLGSLPLGDHASPRRVDTSEVFEDLVAGSAHACGLTAGGSVYCWGRNDSGQLGDASLQTRPTPVAADSPARFVEIDAANDETCGRTADGALYCWGRSNSSDVVRAFPERVRVQVGP